MTWADMAAAVSAFCAPGIHLYKMEIASKADRYLARISRGKSSL